MKMKQIQTTVYRLPGAGFAEKGRFVYQFRRAGLLWEKHGVAEAARLPGWPGDRGANS